MSHKQKTQETF